MTERLTHVDDSGRVRMVDISAKEVTQRAATARGLVRCSEAALRLVAANQVSKGNVVETARIAGVMAAKRTPELIPLCHPLPLRHVDVDITLDERTPGIVIESTVRVEAATGVEMEALTAVAVAALTVIDMIKAVDRWATVTDIALLRKEGGRSGRLTRGDRPPDAGP